MSSEPEAAPPHQHPTDIAEVGGPDGVERLVRSLVDIMHQGGLTKLDVAVGPLSVRLRGKIDRTRPANGGAAMAALGSPIEPERTPERVITAPMIGTFYATPSPGAQPFVAIGDRIAIGHVVGIIEAMKIMNEIVADQTGEVIAILATNGQPVEYGSPLILLAPDGGS